MQRSESFFAGLFLAGLSLGAIASEVAVLTPVADTSIMEIVPANNFGGAKFFNAGTTQAGTRNRGLIRFDPASVLPRGAKVLSAELSLEVVGRPSDGFAAGVFELRRVLRSWGEGAASSPDVQHPGIGASAAEGEATWLERFAGRNNPWAAPGGVEGVDYSAAIVAEQTIYGLPDSPYVFASTPQMVADVQAWVDRPGENFGWMLLARDEAIRFTARRFASREDAAFAPLLNVEFNLPARFIAVTNLGASVRLDVALEAGGVCVIEASDALGGADSWTVLQSIPARDSVTNITLIEPIRAARRFFRIRLDP